ncbi:MAG: TIR domain-containing protein [Flavobacteriaceae bacterium]
MGRKINIFVIYTLADKAVMQNLLRHTDPLKKVLDLSIWHDDPLIPGKPWKSYFESRIHHTDIFLLLVSKDFMNSQFIREPEFKAVVNRHRENKALVIPVIIDNCQWDVDLKLIDHDFKLSELEVLPEEGKPVREWDSPDQAYKNIVGGLETIITPYADNLKKEESNNEMNKKATSNTAEEQAETSYTEKKATDVVTDERISSEEEIKAEEENRRWEEAEAKRRAAVAKRIKEEAEASAKRRAEEDRLWEEAMAKRRAEKVKRIREEAEALVTGKAEEKKRGLQEEESRKNAGEEKRFEETAKAAANPRTEQEKIHKEEVKARPYAKEEKPRKLAAKTNRKVEGVHKKKNTNIKKILIRASLAVVLVAMGIWAFSVFKSGPEEQQPTLPTIKEADLEDSNTLEKTSTDPLIKEANSTKLGVGDIYNGGIIFEIDQTNNTGKIAHLDDAGPMSWTDAANIHEQLGEGWRLPTFDELNLMYRTIGQGANNSGEFSNDLYWSATDYDEYQARLIRFWDGNTSYHYNKNVEQRKFKVRAIRDLK